MKPTPHKSEGEFLPRLVAWETTAACNLDCLHCRAGNPPKADARNELTTAEAEALLADIAALNPCTVILSGGEPLMRADIFELARRGKEMGLAMALATNGSLVDKSVAKKIIDSGIARVSLSLDGCEAAKHDAFRGREGSFASVMRAAETLRNAGVPFQINTSFTRRNVADMARILRLAEEMGAVAWHAFFVVPTGSAWEMRGELLDRDEYEAAMHTIYNLARTSRLQIKPTCAPQFYRVLRQEARREGLAVNRENFGLNARTRGCLAGRHFAFVSAGGEVMPCGYFPRSAGNIRDEKFSQIWRTSELFRKLRDPDLLGGKCGVCEYRAVCGGCRARAVAESGDFLGEETMCPYVPGGEK